MELELIKTLGDELIEGERLYFMVKTADYTKSTNERTYDTFNLFFTDTYADAIDYYNKQNRLYEAETRDSKVVVYIYKMNKKTFKKKMIKTIDDEDTFFNNVLCNYTEYYEYGAKQDI